MYYSSYKCLRRYIITTNSTIMKLFAFAVLLVVAVASVHARPRYIAVPLDDVQLLELADYAAQNQGRAPLRRITRRTGYTEAEELEAQEAQEAARFERQAGGGGGGHDHVDYGAHTGHHGAFGWYADFPVHTGH